MKPISRVEVQRKYPGKWVAFDKDRITVVAVSNDAKKAYEKAKRLGVKIPSLMKVPKESLPYMGGAYHEIQ